MKEDMYYWWYSYHHFSPGDEEYNLPHTGEVINYYIQFHQWSLEEAAQHLQCTERYIQKLTSKRNKNMPQLLPRRIFLAKTLNIPPALLGLNALALFQPGNDSDHTSHKQPSVLQPETMLFYERLLTVSWELYYTSAVEKAAASVLECFALINKGAAGSTGIEKDQYDAMRCRFYQLSSLIERDRLNVDLSLDHEHEAVKIAYRLQNAELLASSLLRRARIYIKRREYALAYEDVKNMLPYADLSRDPLRGKCYQMAGESLGYLAGQDSSLQEKCLKYFDKAAKIARSGNLSPDGSFVKTDVTSVLIEKAEALTLFGRYDDAHQAIAIAHRHLSPEQTRWKINLLLAEAGTFYAQREVSNCCLTLIEALEIARAIQLSGKEARVRDLYTACQHVDAQNVDVQRLGKLFSRHIS